MEWYLKTVPLGIKSIYFRIEKEWLINYWNWNHMEIIRSGGIEWDATDL